MMRSRPSSSMQKTYDDCYLICSTAVYFEGQNNEAEALRSWRSALDQIYYHNAYKVPANYQPRSETERALRDSLRDMEIQCKERVDLLEALRQSRKDAKSQSDSNSSAASLYPSTMATSQRSSEPDRGWIGQGTIPAVSYPDISRPPRVSGAPPPPLPHRHSATSRAGSAGSQAPKAPNSNSSNGLLSLTSVPSPPSLPVPKQVVSRSPSPEKKGLLSTLRNGGERRRLSRPSSGAAGRIQGPAAAAKAATQAWGTLPRNESERLGQSLGEFGESSTTINSIQSDYRPISPIATPPSRRPSGPDNTKMPERREEVVKPPSPTEFLPPKRGAVAPNRPLSYPNAGSQPSSDPSTNKRSLDYQRDKGRTSNDKRRPSPPRQSASDVPPVRDQRPSSSNDMQSSRPNQGTSQSRYAVRGASPSRRPTPNSKPTYLAARRPMAKQTEALKKHAEESSRKESATENVPGLNLELSGPNPRPKRQPAQKKCPSIELDQAGSDPESADSSGESQNYQQTAEERAWQAKVESMMKNLPKGIDEGAAKQILNEIVIQGDEVQWDDVAGLDVAKNALKEAVVYPFLRPDLFMGLREPARGMLLFGPPGTGKTMLARAVATESKSTFFAISASSLTSKFLGESEKLVRALFALARVLAPSIIFIDEIDSLLSSRSDSGEHEASRRIKTEFLIQWSDLARAAAGKDTATDRSSSAGAKAAERGDASRILVLAATNLPWAIDEAARRRFVRRQYIPLPEGDVRASQLRTLISHQKHSLSEEDIAQLVAMTDSFSGSDITALAKDAAMGPLRSLGEALLHMSTEQIRPISMQDFEKSLVSIRPSVSSKGLEQFEAWAREFGERGG